MDTGCHWGAAKTRRQPQTLGSSNATWRRWILEETENREAEEGTEEKEADVASLPKV